MREFKGVANGIAGGAAIWALVLIVGCSEVPSSFTKVRYEDGKGKELRYESGKDVLAVQNADGSWRLESTTNARAFDSYDARLKAQGETLDKAVQFLGAAAKRAPGK